MTSNQITKMRERISEQKQDVRNRHARHLKKIRRYKKAASL